MLNFNNVVNFYLDHPPFTIQDQAKYLDLVQNEVETTLLEISENDPIVEEKTIFLPIPPIDAIPDGKYTTGSVTDATGQYVWLDLYKDIDPTFLSFIVFKDKETIPSLISTYISYEVVQSAIRNGNLFEIMALRDGINITIDWLTDKVSKVVYKDTKIKVKPGIEYYVIYNRYRQVGELQPQQMKIFKDLLGCNIILDAYETDLFQSEDGVSSFSMSGLSISFNSAKVEERIKSARERKDKIISMLSMDCSEIGTF